MVKMTRDLGMQGWAGFSFHSQLHSPVVAFGIGYVFVCFMCLRI